MESKFDPHLYGITVRRMRVDDELLYVAKVAELPHVAVYEESFEAAYTNAAENIKELYEAAMAQDRSFPSPVSHSESHGRFTLRMPGWLHANLQSAAEKDDVSLNSHICNILIAHQSAESVIAQTGNMFAAMSARRAASLRSVWAGHTGVKSQFAVVADPASVGMTVYDFVVMNTPGGEVKNSPKVKPR